MERGFRDTETVSPVTRTSRRQPADGRTSRRNGLILRRNRNIQGQLCKFSQIVMLERFPVSDSPQRIKSPVSSRPKMASAAHPVLPFNVSRSRKIRFPYMSFAPRIRCSIAEGPTIPSSRAFGSSETADCVIVGGGISGLCVAQALATKHAGIAPKVIVTEARDRVGGNITTIERDGYFREEGPNSFQPSDPILTMVVDSGLKDDLVLGDPNAPRFVLWDGKLRPVPARPTDLPIFDLMSTGGKLRAGFGALGLRPAPPVTGA